MNANAIRRETVDTAARRGDPGTTGAAPSRREIDAFARGSGVQRRAPRFSVDDLASAEVATVGALMSFVERSMASSSSDPHERKMASCLRIGDYDGALFAACVLAYRDASHWQARRVKTWCVQLSSFTRVAHRSSPRAVLTMVVDWDVLAAYPLTREQAYMLSLVDGISTVSDVLDASAFPVEVGESILAALLAAGLIAVHT